jgi:hypothetical protein
LFSGVEQFALFLVGLELVVDVAGHLGHIGVHVDVLVLVEPRDDLLDVLDVVLEFFLLKFHGSQLGFRVSVEYLHSGVDGVLNVLGTFEHHPSFIDVFRTKGVLEVFQSVVDLRTFVDFFLDQFEVVGHLVHIFLQGCEFLDVLGSFPHLVEDLQNLGVDCIVLFNHSTGNHILEVLVDLFIFVQQHLLQVLALHLEARNHDGIGQFLLQIIKLP